MPDPETPLFDADNHYYEPRDAFTRCMEPRFRDKAIRVENDAKGRAEVWVGDKPFTFLENPFTDTTIKPGALRDFLRNLGSGAAAYEEVREPIQPEYIERGARLAKMDEQGLQSILLFPTLAVCVEHFMKDDVEQTYANVHAFNRWLEEEWGFDHLGRLYAVPLMSLLDVDRAVEELEFVMKLGARVVHLRPGPAFGRSPASARISTP